MSIIRPISTHITQDFDGAYYKEKPGYIRTVNGVKRGRRARFDGSSYRTDLHLAIDYGAPIGTPVRAVQRGRVLKFGTDSTGGVFLYLRVKSNATHQIVAFYYHLKPGSIRVKIGQVVEKGTIIALSGNSGGVSTGGHLHFTLIRGGRYETCSHMFQYGMRYDPQPFIDGRHLYTIL